MINFTSPIDLEKGDVVSIVYHSITREFIVVEVERNGNRIWKKEDAEIINITNKTNKEK